MLSARLYKQEKLAAEICEELGDSEQRLRDLMDRRIKISQEEIEERYQTESLKLLEVTHNTFGSEIDKLREAVYESRQTPKKEAEAYVELADRCSRMLQATRNAQERLRTLSVASPQRTRNI
jgi:predicted transcriptional regulator